MAGQFLLSKYCDFECRTASGTIGTTGEARNSSRINSAGLDLNRSRISFNACLGYTPTRMSWGGAG